MSHSKISNRIQTQRHYEQIFNIYIENDPLIFITVDDIQSQ